MTLDDETRSLLVGEAPDAGAEAMLAACGSGGRSAFVRYLEGLDGHPTADAVLAAVTVTLAWGPLMRRRTSRLTVETLPWWMRLFGTLLGASVEADRHQADRFCGVPNEEILGRRSLTEVAYLALLGQEAQAEDLFAFQTLIGLLLTGNGPGAISIQGVKGAVSADGPETPERVQLNKALVGFLSLRLRPRRQRLRGHRLPARPVPRCRSGKPGGSQPRPRPEGAGDALHG